MTWLKSIIRRCPCLAAPVVILCLLVLSGCSRLVDTDQGQAGDQAQAVAGGDVTVGQTFVARHAGLQSVDIWLAPLSPGDGALRLALRESPDAQADLAVAELPSGAIGAPGYYRFVFPPLPDSHGRYYYARLQVQGAGEFGIGSGPPSSYIDGAMYQDDAPVDAQMAFRLAYGSTYIVRDLLVSAIKALGLLALAAFLYLLPGWGLLAWLAPRGLFAAREQFAIAIALGLAIYPILFYLTSLAGIPLGRFYAILPGGAGLLALIWRYGDRSPRELAQRAGEWRRSRAALPDLLLLFVVVCLFVTRLLPVRGLEFPMWGDSYQHTVITQLLLDNGGLFTDWTPYAPLRSFTYHFGFHTQMAVAAWLSGLPAPEAVVWMAQVINALAVLVLYSLVFRISGSRWGAVVGVIAGGLLLPMPMYYVNWGRYTQLSGQVLLVGAILLSWRTFEFRGIHWRLLVLNWIALGGLAFTHYRLLILYVLFVAAWLVVSLRRKQLRWTLATVAAAGSGAAVLFLPWFLSLRGGGILTIAAAQLQTSPAGRTAFELDYNSIGDPAAYAPVLIWFAMLAGLAAGLWSRRRVIVLMVVWWLLVLLAANPAWLGLPGTGLITNFAIAIAVYIPTAVLVSELWVHVVERWQTRRRMNLLAAGILAIVALAGSAQRLQDVHPSTFSLVRRPDARAMAWILANTPADAHFMVNAMLAYGGFTAAGSDGGWWLSYLTGRESTLPPLLYATEVPAEAGYRDWVRSVASWIEQGKVIEPDVVGQLRTRGVTHVYVGQAQGRVGTASPSLNPAQLAASPYYRLIYHQDMVWIFRLVD